jgi:hypothetical protein
MYGKDIFQLFNLIFVAFALGPKKLYKHIMLHFDFQKWINAFTEHAAFSTHYLTQGHVQFDDSDEEEHDIKPLGSMQVSAWKLYC